MSNKLNIVKTKNTHPSYVASYTLLPVELTHNELMVT